jgi:hypothetical protein
VLRGRRYLFSRNTSAGALNVTNVRPSLNWQFGGFAKRYYSPSQPGQRQGAVNVPSSGYGREVADRRLSCKRDGYLTVVDRNGTELGDFQRGRPAASFAARLARRQRRDQGRPMRGLCEKYGALRPGKCCGHRWVFRIVQRSRPGCTRRHGSLQWRLTRSTYRVRRPLSTTGSPRPVSSQNADTNVGCYR